MKKKIVLIGPVYPYKGGIAHYTSLLYQALSKAFDVKLISYKMQYPKILFRKEQKDYSNDMFKIEGTEYWINTANPFNIVGVAKKINRLNPDAVLVQWWHPYFAPCYKILTNHLNKKIKILFTCHNVFPHERFPMDRVLTKMVLKAGDGFIVQSRQDEQDLLSVKPNANERYTPHPTYNAFKLRGIDSETGRNEIVIKDGYDINTQTKLLLFFGFVREYKGLKHLLRAMPEIVSKLPDCKLLVVGAFSNDKEEYLNLIKELEIEGQVYLKDTYTADNEVEKYFVASDLVVLPYEDATQSGIVQIAYGFDKPCLVTRVGGLPDVVTDQKTGYVVEPRNPHAIAEAVIDFFENNRYQEMYSGICDEADRFSWERMTEEIESLLEEK